MWMSTGQLFMKALEKKVLLAHVKTLGMSGLLRLVLSQNTTLYLHPTANARGHKLCCFSYLFVTSYEPLSVCLPVCLSVCLSL